MKPSSPVSVSSFAAEKVFDLTTVPSGSATSESSTTGGDCETFTISDSPNRRRRPCSRAKAPLVLRASTADCESQPRIVWTRLIMSPGIRRARGPASVLSVPAWRSPELKMILGLSPRLADCNMRQVCISPLRRLRFKQAAARGISKTAFLAMAVLMSERVILKGSCPRLDA